MKIETLKSLRQEIKELEKSMEIQEGFFDSLLSSDSDWSFIIKLHAFFEAACTILIIKALGKEELADLISRLEMSGTIYGKTVFISKLSLLSKDAVQYIRKLSEVRNYYVHNLKNTSLTLANYLNNLDKNQKNSFINKIGYDTFAEIEIKDIKIKKEDFISENPRIAIHLGAFSVLSEIILQMKHIGLKFEELEFKRKAADMFVSILESLDKTKTKPK